MSDDRRCIECDAPARWQAPSPITGRVQGWNRMMVETRNGWRCEQRSACKRRQLEALTDAAPELPLEQP